MDREITKEQIGSVVAILVAGKVPYDDVQAFIDKYRDVSSKKKREREAKGDRSDFITVLALSAGALIRLAREKADDRLFRCGGSLCAPSFIRIGSARELYLRGGVPSGWDARWSFVAFREFKIA